MDLNFRKYQASDLDELVEMVLGLYSKDATQTSHMTLEKVAKSVENLTVPQSAGLIYIFEKGSRIIGYGIVNRFWSNEFTGYILYIDELYVKSDFRNSRIGAQFFAYLEEHPGNDSVAFMLEAVPTNEKAIRFYEKIGFTKHHNYMMFKQLV